MAQTADRTYDDSPGGRGSGSQVARLVVSWLVVGLPLTYGVWQTVAKASKLFVG